MPHVLWSLLLPASWMMFMATGYCLGRMRGDGKPVQPQHDTPATSPARNMRNPLHDAPRASEGTNWRGPKVGWHNILICVHGREWNSVFERGYGCEDCTGGHE